jgi:predicted amidohydrolase YtcJ
MKRKLTYLSIFFAIVCIVLYAITSDFKKTEATIYINGTIITIDSLQPSAEAMFVKDGIIAAIGNTIDIEKLATSNTKIIDLQNKTVLPGFIDSHTHVALSSFLNKMIDLSGFKHANNKEVWGYLKEQIQTKKEGEWILCKGIDPILVEDLITPNIHFLDSIAPNNPILLISQSLHTYWANSKTFKKAGITKETADPSANSYYEKDSTGNLTGVITEQEAFTPILNVLKEEVLTSNFLIDATTQTLKAYAKNGNTTVVSAGLTINDAKPLRLYQHLSDAAPSLLNQFLATFGMIPKRSQFPRHFIYIRHDRDFLLPAKKTPNDFYNIIGVKHWYDGSPYTGSMFMNAPYLVSDLTKNGLHIKDGSRGKPLIKKDDLYNFIDTYQKKGWQIAFHSQGDISSQHVLKAFDSINSIANVAAFRHRVEHCLLLTKESLKEMKRLNISPSFHTNHLYYYGKSLTNDILGEERSQQILPIGFAQQLGLKYSMHADHPMFESKPFHLIQTAVLRQTKEGDTLGLDQRISLLNGLKSMTINAAWQIHMEDKIGSLQKGKYADFIVIDKNPFHIPTTELDKIKILQTFINGNKVE